MNRSAAKKSGKLGWNSRLCGRIGAFGNLGTNKRRKY
jgi:hypothetical protein